MIFKDMYQSYSNIIESFIVLGCGLTTYSKDFDDDDDDDDDDDL